MRVRDLVVSLLVVVPAGLQMVGTASADMLILESNVPRFQLNARIPDDPLPALPPGGRVKVLLLPSNETKVFEGPRATAGPRRETGAIGGTREPRDMH